MKKMARPDFPVFPSTPHHPHRPNSSQGDVVAILAELGPLYAATSVLIEEKCDGSSLGISLVDGYPVVRNRSRQITKGANPPTPAYAQYKTVFQWFQQNVGKFHYLNQHFDREVAVYGEWMYMSHGLVYDKLPDVFVAYDIWDGHDFVLDEVRRTLLWDAGFSLPSVLHRGAMPDDETLEVLCETPSKWIGGESADPRIEGLYIRHDRTRYKMVRSDFFPGQFFDPENSHITRNTVVARPTE